MAVDERDRAYQVVGLIKDRQVIDPGSSLEPSDGGGEWHPNPVRAGGYWRLAIRFSTLGLFLVERTLLCSVILGMKAQRP